ncbi:MAG: GAF domain-containing protein [Candidatus Sulfotelmatobacter sp.]
MEAIAPVLRPLSSNRRARVRQKVHVPAYASFRSGSESEMLDLYEVLDISESGIALHCSSPMEINQPVELRLDLAEASGQISCTARVAWSDSTGRVGLALPDLSGVARHDLSEWLFLNALAAAANAEPPELRSENFRNSLLRQNYTDILSAASAVQREAESLGVDLEAVLALVASRSQSLLRAAGAAIALDEKKLEEKKLEEKKEDKNQAQNAGTMLCRASSGPSAPPVGVTLQVGSGFSGECVRTGKLLRCDDTETDERVDRQSCRALGIRSMIAVPLRIGAKVVGLLEVFSLQSNAFSENDSAVLQRLAETIQAAVSRSARVHDSSAPPPASPKPFTPAPGSVLFAYPPESAAEKDLTGNPDKDQDKVGGIRLPRAHLYLLFLAAATIFLVLGFLAEPWIQEKLQARSRNNNNDAEHTVLASSQAPLEIANSAAILSADSANLAQLRELASRGDPAAENALGLLYAAGDEKQGIQRDETDAARWFMKAAEHGNVPAQSKLGSLYWGGRGVTKDDNQAYFWTVLARANGDDASKALAPFIATRLTPAQRAAIEQQAEQWLERHESSPKSVANR